MSGWFLVVSAMFFYYHFLISYFFRTYTCLPTYFLTYIPQSANKCCSLFIFPWILSALQGNVYLVGNVWLFSFHFPHTHVHMHAHTQNTTFLYLCQRASLVSATNSSLRFYSACPSLLVCQEILKMERWQPPCLCSERLHGCITRVPCDLIKNLLHQPSNVTLREKGL